MQIADGGVADFAEVMRQDLRREADGNTFCSLCQQQRIFDRQRDWLFVAAVVRHLPFCSLGIEHGVERKFRQSGFDVSRSGSAGACQDITPVTLRVDEQVFLSHLHQGVTDAGVAVRVELHCVAHDVGHFVVAAVIHSFHRVQDTALHRL